VFLYQFASVFDFCAKLQIFSHIALDLPIFLYCQVKNRDYEYRRILFPDYINSFRFAYFRSVSSRYSAFQRHDGLTPTCLKAGLLYRTNVNISPLNERRQTAWQKMAFRRAKRGLSCGERPHIAEHASKNAEPFILQTFHCRRQLSVNQYVRRWKIVKEEAVIFQHKIS